MDLNVNGNSLKGEVELVGHWRVNKTPASFTGDRIPRASPR